MKVLHFCTADNYGGAARAAYRLSQGLRAAGVDSRMLVAMKTETADENVAVVPRSDTAARKFYIKLISRIERESGLQYLLETWRDQFLDHPFYRAADVLHFHNLHSNFFPLTLVQKMAQEKPIVWTLHDQWPMTGHCTYPELAGCDKFLEGCRQCPDLADYPSINVDTTPLLFSIKKRQYVKQNVRKVIAPCRWMETQARRSLIFRDHDIVRVPYGVDTAVFHPMDKNSLRARFGVALDEKVLLFSALDLSYERKGGRYLLAALQKIVALTKETPLKLFLVALGEKTGLDLNVPGVRVHAAGVVAGDELMNEYYNLADLYVHPAIADNLPNAVLESLACGTPVVAFDTGGLPDMVRPGVTGKLAALKDSDSLAGAIRSLLSDESRLKRMSIECRRIAEQEYALGVQAKRVMEIYEEVR